MRWIKVRAGEAPAHGVRYMGAGRVGRAGNLVYFVWVQARIKDEPPIYAGSRVDENGHIVSFPNTMAAWARTSSPTWLCDAGSLQDAKDACREDVESRERKATQ